MRVDPSLAVIGGTGVYDIDGLADVDRLDLATPYGKTSDAITLGTLSGTRVAFLPRHGRGHRLLPSEVPSRANIWALKSLGVRQVLSISAVGSLREDIEPRHFVVPGQIIDQTTGRPGTFFGDGVVAHISLAEPFCPTLSSALATVAQESGAMVHRGGTCLVIDGPRFATRGESNLYRSWGASVIGMTAAPEAQLAREAEICYTALMAVTDYDSWHSELAPVTADMIMAHLQKNVEASKAIIRVLAGNPPDSDGCRCQDALADALITPMDLVPDQRKRELAPIIGRYLK